jgi:hypothetical protein
MGGLIGLVLIGTIVYIKFLGGGANVAACLNKAAKLAEASGGSQLEKSSILRQGGGLSDSAAKARFGSSGIASSYTSVGSSSL